MDVVGKGDEASQVGMPIAVLKCSAHRDVAQAFVDLVLSPEAAPVLKKHGFVFAPAITGK